LRGAAPDFTFRSLFYNISIDPAKQNDEDSQSAGCYRMAVGFWRSMNFVLAFLSVQFSSNKSEYIFFCRRYKCTISCSVFFYSDLNMYRATYEQCCTNVCFFTIINNAMSLIFFTYIVLLNSWKIPLIIRERYSFTSVDPVWGESEANLQRMRTPFSRKRSLFPGWTSLTTSRSRRDGTDMPRRQ